MGSRPRATSLPTQLSLPNLTDIQEDPEGAAAPYPLEEQANLIPHFRPSFSVPVTPTAAYSHGPGHGHHRSSSLDRLQTGASVVRPLTYRDRIISPRFTSGDATPTTDLSRHESPQRSRRTSKVDSRTASKTGTPFRYYSRRPSPQDQASTGIDTDYIDTRLRELIHHDSLSRTHYPRQPQAALTAGLHVYPDGTFIAPLRRDITTRRWEQRVEPSTPVLARTLSWPPTKQFDPTIDETKQRWGTPDWGSAEESQAVDDESSTVPVQDQDTGGSDPLQVQGSVDETPNQDGDTVGGTPKLRTINAMLIDFGSTILAVDHLRLFTIPLAWLYTAQYMKTKPPRCPRSLRDLSFSIIWDTLWYVLIVIPLTFLHPPPLITQLAPPLPRAMMRAFPILQIRIVRTLLILYGKLVLSQESLWFMDQTTDFVLTRWAEPLVFKPFRYIRRHILSHFGSMSPSVHLLFGWVWFYGVVAVLKFIVVDVFHGSTIRWLW